MTLKNKTTPVRPTHDGYFRPGIHALPELPAIRWTWWRWVLLAIAVLCSAYFFWTVCANSWSWVLKFLAPHNGPLDIPWPTQQKNVLASFWRDLKLVTAGTGVLLCLWGIAGMRTVGIGRERGSWEHHRVGLGFYMRTVYPASVLMPYALVAALTYVPQLRKYTASRSGTAPKTEWYEIFLSFAAGYTEEIIATVFLYWLLQRIPWRKHTTTLAATGWGTAIIILAHLSYHTYYGIRVLTFVPAVYFTVICWRYTRSFLALMVGHAVWDLGVLIPNYGLELILWLALAMIGLVMDMYMNVLKVKPSQS